MPEGLPAMYRCSSLDALCRVVERGDGAHVLLAELILRVLSVVAFLQGPRVHGTMSSGQQNRDLGSTGGQPAGRRQLEREGAWRAGHRKRRGRLAHAGRPIRANPHQITPKHHLRHSCTPGCLLGASTFSHILQLSPASPTQTGGRERP